jgi:hypothetical protein
MTSLDCSLLCADACAYGIAPDATLLPPQPWYARVGFLEPPSIVESGTADIDAALVGANANGILVAFRGTLPPDNLTLPVLLDWLQSFSFAPAISPLFAGTVHSGFLKGFQSLWPGVQAAVDSLRKRYPASPLFVTGHSKGGVLATLAAWQFNKAGITPDAVVTFASPRPGDAAFAKAYTDLGIPHRRYENYLDAVPFYPPDLDLLEPLRALPGWSAQFESSADWDYQAVGELRYIQQDGSVVGDSLGLAAARVGQITENLLDGHASRVADAHALVAPSPGTPKPAGAALVYSRGVCPDPPAGELDSTAQQSGGR